MAPSGTVRKRVRVSVIVMLCVVRVLVASRLSGGQIRTVKDGEQNKNTCVTYDALLNLQKW